MDDHVMSLLTEEGALWIVKNSVPDIQNVILDMVRDIQRKGWKENINILNKEYFDTWSIECYDHGGDCFLSNRWKGCQGYYGGEIGYRYLFLDNDNYVWFHCEIINIKNGKVVGNLPINY